jgi:hypothetical protein
MHKDNSGVGEWAKHTRKRTGLRRRVNKGVRRNTKAVLREGRGDSLPKKKS